MTTPAEGLPTVHLQVGELDPASVTRLRQLLRSCPSGPDRDLVVDLSGAGDRHDMTLFALLTEHTRPPMRTGVGTTALRPSHRLGQLLTSIGISVRAEGPSHNIARAQHLVVGALPSPDGTDGPRPGSCLACTSRGSRQAATA